MVQPYHTALSWWREQEATPAESVEVGDSCAFVHDLLAGPLPAVYGQCDVFYCEPPWRTGFSAFERRAGRADTFGRSWSALLEAAFTGIPSDVPAVFTLGRWTSLPEPDLRLSGSENGAACVFWVYGAEKMPVSLREGLADVELIQCLA